MSIDSILWISCGVAQTAVIGLLLYRRIWRLFPIFFAYSIWVLLSGLSAYWIHLAYPAHAYLTFYFIEAAIDSTLLFGVLVELGWSVLRPLRSALSWRMLVIVSLLILGLGAAIWTFTALPGTATLARELRALMHLQQTFSILQVLIFLALAGCSQFLSIGWRDRELQIVTGLGFTSLVGLVIAMFHAHQAFRAQYHLFSQIAVASYFCSLVYWAVSFAQQEEKRREFSPQMETLLLAVAGAAHSTRVSLTEAAGGSRRKSN